MQNKSDTYKRPLKHKRIEPQALAEVCADKSAFQGWKIKKLSDISFPLTLEKEEIIIDFGGHFTGYLNIELAGRPEHIPDSPTNIAFSFAEMPIELAETAEDSENSLSVSWLQNDFKTIAFMSYKGSLERRYSFRYLKLKRTDSVRFAVDITALYIDAVSAVDIDDVLPLNTTDSTLAAIDKICVNTLKECEQDVFEDGPKRDRRLWIGDLRLQALVDYVTFRNTDLIKRCIYLFAEHLNEKGLVPPCVFPDTPPYADQWFYLDYSLCFVLCLADYLENTGDKTLPEELYGIALHQIEYTDSVFDRTTGIIDEGFFIDHGNYDRSTASLGYFAYVLRSMIGLSEKLGKPADKFKNILADVNSALLSKRDGKTGLFTAKNGEISWQSQVWAALSGALSCEETKGLLKKTAEYNPGIHMSSPFMTHYYLEALYSCGMAETANEYIKSYWGAIINAGFDCCPECFDVTNDRVTPYSNPVLNSACHAWSCTPSYLIRKGKA